MAAGTDEYGDDLFMSVRLHEERRLCKVLVTSQTTGHDVIELLKPDNENVYCLVEIWKGCERPVTQGEKLKNVLLQWGSDIDNVVFMLKRKPSSSRQKKSPRNSPVSGQLQDKQQKVENLERELEQKERHLKSLRSKETSKSSLKTKYVKLLETRVIKQEEKLMSLQSVQDELFNTRLENENLVIELSRLRSMFALKHQQLAEATAKVELLSRELARSQPYDLSKNNGLQNERNTQHPKHISNQSEKQQLSKQQGLTRSQLLQLQANNGYTTSTLNPNEDMGKDILFLKHGILQERNDLNSIFSWQNDEENDTETSADSGHVSNDSPSYQHRFGSSFQFYHNPPGMYSGKVERFDIDQDFDIQLTNNHGDAGRRGLKGVSDVDAWSKLKGNYASHANEAVFNPKLGPAGIVKPTQQLFLDTDMKGGGAGPLSRQRQVNHGSPQSTSSMSSMSPESSKNDLLPGLRPTRMGSQTDPSVSGNVIPNNDLRDVNSARDSGSRSSTPTNECNQPTFSVDENHKSNWGSKTNTGSRSSTPTNERNQPTFSGDENHKSNRGSKTNTPTKESKSFLSNESSSDESNIKRSAGSISSYHRRREGSFDNSSGLIIGPFAKEQTPSQTSNSGSENLVHRVRTSSIEKPAIPNSLVIPKGNDSRNGYLSPLETKKSPNFNHSNQVKSNSPTCIHNERSSLINLDIKQQSAKNPNQQIINRKKSPLSTDRSILADPKVRSSPSTSGSKSISSHRTFDTTGRSSPKVVESKAPNSDRVFETKTRTSSQVSESRAETSISNTVSRTDKEGSDQSTVTSPGVQDVLKDVTTLKVTAREVNAREVKPIQIQTRAEKDSDNIPVEKTTAKSNVPVADVKLPSHSQINRVHKPPKPVPRKRTKTPPARGSCSETNILVKSSQETIVTKSSGNNVKNAGNVQSKDSKSNNLTTEFPIDDRLGTKTCDSILRSTKNKVGKKNVKRVSLDPHAVLLHASLEGELELVKNIIHQVEDPSYPNNEGLTALHHAVCNSHDAIVKFLIEYGCDINASDMQGWTSLHCAAANNSVEMCKFLINRGACVFAVTAIEGKTPSRCCEKDSENFKDCFAYLSDVEENFGVSNDGVVYAVYAYEANRKDELSFECGERLTVVRRGDVTETEWWWARDTRNNFGYIPRNLLGLHPPVAPDV